MTTTTQTYDVQNTAAGVFEPFVTLIRRVRHYASIVEERRQVRAMLDLDDHLLRDIGLERDDIREALSGPLSASPGAHLQRVKEQRNRNRLERLLC
ncbi:MAG: DUF1127 domain-containing protein [Methyloligellaceae bacterium]